MKILVIEDCSNDFDLFKLKIEKISPNIQIQWLQIADEIIQFLHKNQNIDAIFLDFHLPGKDASEILAMVKADKKFCKIPIYILSGAASSNRVTSLLNSGAQEIIDKNTNFEKSLEAILKQLKMNKKKTSAVKKPGLCCRYWGISRRA